MKSKSILILAFLALALAVHSCSEDSGSGNTGPNTAPSTVLVSAPAQGSTSSFQVYMDWAGTDSDGRVVSYEIAWRSGPFDSSMFDSLDWGSTSLSESTFVVLADTCCAEGDSTTWRHTHTFFIRAVDDDGERDPEPVYRSFIATTKAPTTEITSPGSPVQSSCITFRWRGNDEDGEVVQYRYVWKPDNEYPAERPPDPENPSWSDWGTVTEWTEDFKDEDNPARPYSFYVQSRDNAGAIETAFKRNENHLIFYVDTTRGSHPWIKISVYRGRSFDSHKEFLDSRSTSSPLAMETPINVWSGDTLSFRIEFSEGGDASMPTGIIIQENNGVQPIWWDPIDAGQTEAIYPGLGGLFTVGSGISTLHVWVKDDYCRFGSESVAYVRLSGS
ncbi:MAG: hypothetical protein ABIJ00_02390 [Candidatus Eisenbacteria bacterium]